MIHGAATHTAQCVLMALCQALSRSTRILVRAASFLQRCTKSYINDLLKHLEDQNVGVSISNLYLGAPTCANDIIFAADNSYDLQTMLKVVETYASQERFNIDPSK